MLCSLTKSICEGVFLCRVITHAEPVSATQFVKGLEASGRNIDAHTAAERCRACSDSRLAPTSGLEIPDVCSQPPDPPNIDGRTAVWKELNLAAAGDQWPASCEWPTKLAGPAN